MVALLLGGCAPTGSQLDELIGHTLSEARDMWGPPDEFLESKNNIFTVKWYSTTGNCEWLIHVYAGGRIVGYKAAPPGCLFIGRFK